MTEGDRMARTTGMWSYARVSFDTHKKRWFADGAGVDATGTPLDVLSGLAPRDGRCAA